MRPITGINIIAFYDSRTDLLVLTEDGEFAYRDYSDVNGDATAYEYFTTTDGDEVQILLERDTIEQGEWFPDALDDDLNLIPSVADEMAAIINTDGILPSRILKATDASKAWKASEADTNRLAKARAFAVAEVVVYCGGNQSQAARLLNLDQSTVNKLVKKAEIADTSRTRCDGCGRRLDHGETYHEVLWGPHSGKVVCGKCRDEAGPGVQYGSHVHP